MDFWMTVVVATSLAVLVVLSIVHAFESKNLRVLLAQTLSIVAFIVLLKLVFGFPVPKTTIAKSPSSELAVAIALFVFMVFGMLAQFLYSHFALAEEERKRFDWGLFIAPLFASPIIFVPLLAALQNADIDLTQLTAPRIMVLLVAFQNGFFWKQFFDKQRQSSVSK